MAIHVLQLMAEYGVELPLWHRLSDDNIRPAEAGELSLSRELQSDLAAWNATFQAIALHGFAFGSHDDERRHGVDAFSLAARVQAELGDEWHVWTGAGAGMSGYEGADGRSAVVLSGRDGGADVSSWSRGRCTLLTARRAGAGERTAREIIGWRASTDRAGAPFGDATSRIQGLRAAAHLQVDLGLGTRVMFFAGASGYADAERALR